MKAVLAVLLLCAGVELTAAETVPASRPLRVAVTCFKSSEQISGFNKICFYDCLGSQAAITIASTQLCPLSINR